MEKAKFILRTFNYCAFSFFRSHAISTKVLLFPSNLYFSSKKRNTFIIQPNLDLKENFIINPEKSLSALALSLSLHLSIFIISALPLLILTFNLSWFASGGMMSIFWFWSSWAPSSVSRQPQRWVSEPSSEVHLSEKLKLSELVTEREKKNKMMMRDTSGQSLKIGCHLRLKIKEHLSDFEREGTDSSKVDRERRDHNALLNTFQLFLRPSEVYPVKDLNARRDPKWKRKRPVTLWIKRLSKCQHETAGQVRKSTRSLGPWVSGTWYFTSTSLRQSQSQASTRISWLIRASKLWKRDEEGVSQRS